MITSTVSLHSLEPPPSEVSDRKVFGIGLGRTGTSSLSEALNLVGIQTKHFPYDVTTQSQLLAGEPLSMMAQYQGVVDGIAPFYRQLDRLYPSSRFILTVRDQADWLRSVARHAEVRSQHPQHSPAFNSFSQSLQQLTYNTLSLTEQALIEGYQHHVQAVYEYFKTRPDDLLIMDICNGDGWDKLLPFLQLTTPPAPFPHSNDSQTLSLWRQQVAEVNATLTQHIGAGREFIFIDDDQLDLPNAKARPFLEQGGRYWGPPEDDRTAIAELERMRQSGACAVAFAWPAFWWLDHYSFFYNYLQSNTRCVLSSERLLIFNLNP